MMEALIRLLMVVAVAVGSSVQPAAATSWHGNAGWAVTSLGSDYLAIRAKRGTVVTICGPASCWHNAVVNDYGPSSKIRPARVADIAVRRWERICGLPASAGLCLVSITVTGGIDTPARATTPQPTAPQTDISTGGQ